MVKAIDLPKSNTSAIFLGCWERLCAFDFDISNGELAWLKGTLLNRQYHINPKKQGTLTKKQWAELRKTPLLNKHSDETIRNWKKVGDKFSRPQSRKLGLSEMYAKVRAEAAAARAARGKNPPPPPIRTATDKPVPIASFPDCWDVVFEQLEGMGRVANAPDRFDDPREKLGLLEAQEANLKTARGILNELEKAIAKTRKELEDYIAESSKLPDPAPKDGLLGIPIPSSKKRVKTVPQSKQWVDLSPIN